MALKHVHREKVIFPKVIAALWDKTSLRGDHQDDDTVMGWVHLLERSLQNTGTHYAKLHGVTHQKTAIPSCHTQDTSPRWGGIITSATICARIAEDLDIGRTSNPDNESYFGRTMCGH